MRPWERAKGELRKYHEAFEIFLKSGGRKSPEQISSETGIPEKTVRKQSEKFRWRDRLQECENYKLAERKAELDRETKRISLNAAESVGEYLNKILDKLDDDFENSDDKSADSLIKSLQSLTKTAAEIFKFQKERAAAINELESETSIFDAAVRADPEARDLLDKFLARASEISSRKD